MKNNKKGSKLAIGFVIAAIATRLIPHMPNFTAMESLALFSGAYLGWKALAVMTPLLTWYVSDFIINNTTSRVWYPDVDGIVWYADYMPWVLVASIGIIFLGSKTLKKWTPQKLALTAVSSSIIFFIVSNFGTWMEGTLYPLNMVGLTESYIAAIPFFKSSLLSNLAYTAVLFGGYELVHYISYNTKAQLAFSKL